MKTQYTSSGSTPIVGLAVGHTNEDIDRESIIRSNRAKYKSVVGKCQTCKLLSDIRAQYKEVNNMKNDIKV